MRNSPAGPVSVERPTVFENSAEGGNHQCKPSTLGHGIKQKLIVFSGLHHDHKLPFLIRCSLAIRFDCTL